MPTVFLDRDGVINRNRSDYVKTWDEFQFLPGARHAIARLTHAGYRLVVVTNQACIGKGLVSSSAIAEIHSRMLDEIACAGGHIEAVLVCPHRADDACGCRKPAPGLLLRAHDEYGVELSRALLVGDSASDMQAAGAAHVAAILALSGRGRDCFHTAMNACPGDMLPYRVALNLEHAARLILGERFAIARQHGKSSRIFRRRLATPGARSLSETRAPVVSEHAWRAAIEH
jgi:histidinol-phosphate phosphatase family protein